jgi:hypothetical protein
LVSSDIPIRTLFARSSDGCESICVTLFLKVHVNVCCAYRPPDCSAENTKTLLRVIDPFVTDRFLLAGDFNLPHINWDQKTSTDPSARLLLDFLASQNLTQFVDQPTRVNNILDLVISNIDIEKTDVAETFSNADHNTVSFVVPNLAQKTIVPKKFIRLYSKESLSALDQTFFGTHWEQVLSTTFAANDKYETFVHTLTQTVNNIIPLKAVKTNKKPHYPAYLKRLVSEKKRLFRTFKTDRFLHKQAYKRKCQDVKCCLRRFHDARDYKAIARGRGSLYKYVSSRLKPSQNIPTLAHGDRLFISDQDKCETLAEHFSHSFAANPNKGRAPIPDMPLPQNCLSDIYFDVLDVAKALKALPDRVGTSPDDISYKLLRNCADSLSPTITELFRVILDSGDVPTYWRTSIIVPIFKKGDKSDPGNYRPISLTCTLCRVFERLLCKSIVRFLHDTGFFSGEQFGFLKGRSTTTQLLATFDEWFKAIEKNKNVDVIYVDFARAFDSVPHDKLSFKLARAGIGGKLLRFIQSFLTNRTYRVRVNDSFSRSYPVETSVPQGSVLGPLLFLIYINDLPTYLPPEIGVKLFADDVKLYNAHPPGDSCDALHAAVHGLEQWSADWEISIAAHKCGVLYLGKQKTRSRYFINNTPIPEVDSIRDLGVIVDNELKFSDHVSHVIKIAYFKAYQILKAFKTRNLNTLMFAYKVYVRPHLEYAVEAWSPAKVTDSQRLERVQGFFTRKAFEKCGLSKTSYANRLRICDIERLEDRRKLADLSMVYKIVKRRVNIDFQNHFIRSSRHRFHQWQLHKRKHGKEKNFFTRVVNNWNRLTDEIIDAPSPKSFIRRVKKASIALL